MNNFRVCILLPFIFVCLTIHASTNAPLPEAKLTIKVLDEDGRSLSNMPVHVWLSESAVRDGQTDSDGLFVAEGPCTIKDIPISIVKPGYYDSKLTYSYPNYVSVKDHKWQPWNPVVTAMVRRIVNPMPMYAKKVHTVIPALDQFIGYDLVKGDWLAPYGDGAVADVLFQMKKRYVDIRNFDSFLDIVLTNKVDGLQETTLAAFHPSEFKLLRFAPIGGYVITNSHLSESSTNYFRPNEQQSFYFRVRTVTNESGEVTSAHYGKIRGYIGFDVRREKTGTISFVYYLNPTPNDRNLEFDPTRNLFTGLPSREQVREP
jgi:hypothetical protein